MVFRSKVPAACAELDLKLVSRVLAKHHGDIYAAAKELGVSGPNLTKLTWARPKLLDAADDRRFELVMSAQSRLNGAIYSANPALRQWAADRLLSSRAARSHPLAILAPARRGRVRRYDPPAEA